MRSFDINKIKNNMGKVISYEESLKDIVPFNWSKDVLNGKKKIIVTGNKKK